MRDGAGPPGRAAGRLAGRGRGGAGAAGAGAFTVDSTGAVHAQTHGAPAGTVVVGSLDPATGALVLRWSAFPANTFVVATCQSDPFRPGDRPADATATPTDIMASPAAVGTSLFDAVAPTAFGARDLLTAPFEPYDALVCTSRAVVEMVTAVTASFADF